MKASSAASRRWSALQAAGGDVGAVGRGRALSAVGPEVQLQRRRLNLCLCSYTFCE